MYTLKKDLKHIYGASISFSTIILHYPPFSLIVLVPILIEHDHKDLH